MLNFPYQPKSVVQIDPVTKCCTLECPGSNTAAGNGKVFQFDAAFGPDATTENVYENVGSVIVEAVLEGYNGTVFAYGQTGCGKSYTMRGFIERALEHLFEATSTASSETRYLALLSYLEIYNERLRDLLKDNNGAGETLVLKEDPTRGTYVAGGLREVTVKDAEECARFIDEGDKRRAAAATKMNVASSRSHAVLTLALEAIAINEDNKSDSAVRRGRLHLVDLAGSERQGRTGATGERLKEAASINLSLSALGNVISALAAGNGRHVPYRDSKLTRLLRDSLGGNARTLMIACLSPSDIDGDETLSTLRYAARARCIKNKPIINEDPKDALLRQYQLELQKLRKLLEGTDQPYPSELSSKEERKDEEEEAADRLREEQYAMEVERLRKECENSNLSAQRLREELDAIKARYGTDTFDETVGAKINVRQTQPIDEAGREREERQRKKREAAMQEVLKRLEKLTIGGEEQSNDDLRRRRERRRKRLATLAGALEASAQEGNASVFQVYGQLKSTEDALKRMARRVKQLEAETADLQASWDAERRDLLRKELLVSQICDAMVPHLRPGCPFRDVAAVRAAASWCDELGRWRLPDVSPAYIPLPPASLLSRQQLARQNALVPSKPDHNNNSNAKNNENDTPRDESESDEESREREEKKKADIVDTYFRRSRIDALLAHARDARALELNSRLSKSGGSDDLITAGGNCLQLNALNLQSSAMTMGEHDTYRPSVRYKPGRMGRPAWLEDTNFNKSTSSLATMVKKNPPRILEALPSYPHGTNGVANNLSSRLDENSPTETLSQRTSARAGNPRAYHSDTHNMHTRTSPY